MKGDTMNVLLVPLDDRPVTRLLPAMAAAVAGIEVIAPPLDLLGTLGRPGDPAALASWLRDTASKGAIDGAVIAIDMLAHGGLVNSRRTTEPAPLVLERLAVLRDLRAARPELPIYAFNILQRISNADDNGEEKPYWDRYGRAMFRLSQLTDAVERDGRPEDRAELDRLRETIPAGFVEDYLATRRRNHAINLAMIAWAAEGVFDYLAITQDDANPLGFPAMEQRALAARVAELGAFGRVGIYPGADEVATALLARLACAHAGIRPRVYPRYSSVRGPLIVANYEDRPLGETVKGQIMGAGGLVADTPAETDMVLLLNTPGEAQAEAPDGVDYTRVQTAARNLDEFVAALRDYRARHMPVALADVAYSNGADPLLMPRLFTGADPLDLLAFGGWNTAGNTIGSVVGYAFLRLLALRRGATPAEEQAHQALLLTRYLDDWAYQSVVRTTAGIRALADRFGITYDNLGDHETGVASVVTDELRQLYERHLAAHVARHSAASVAIGPVRFPWRRLFEIEVPVEVRSRG